MADVYSVDFYFYIKSSMAPLVGNLYGRRVNGRVFESLQ